MMRMLTAVAASFLIASSASAADSAKNVVLRWHGQSFFEIESSQGTRIVIDPHAIEAYGRKSVVADLVLLSHLHTDHTQVEVVQNRSRAKILSGLICLAGYIMAGFDEEKRALHDRICNTRVVFK